MRIYALLLVLVLLPMASAAPEPVQVDHDVRTPNDYCPDCVGVSVSFEQEEPENCADCAYLWGSASVQKDNDGVTASGELCRGGFVVICVVDAEQTVPL